jgi:ribosomal protein S18 acetylase RimI-like enzyme
VIAPMATVTSGFGFLEAPRWHEDRRPGLLRGFPEGRERGQPPRHPRRGPRGLSSPVRSYTTRPLDAATWEAFAELVERNNGVFGGCWCLGFHEELSRTSAEYNRAGKEQRVREDRAHAALAFAQGGAAQGWCQYGSPEELPRIKHRREYEKDAPPPPDWRITCLFVDKKHRGQGVARAALEGALNQIAEAGQVDPAPG